MSQKIIASFLVTFLLVLCLLVLLFMGQTIQKQQPPGNTLILSPQKIKAETENFTPREPLKDEQGNVLSVPENADSVSPPEERTFIY